MYYFEKNRLSPRQTFPISFDRQWRYFDLRELIVHSENRKYFNDWCKDFPPGLPDFLAALVAQIHYRRQLNQDFVLAALEYCRAMIEEQAYERTSLRDISLTDTGINHVMLVAGCQGPTVRKARVRAAYYVLSRLPRHISAKIVFSGRNPAEPPTRVQILTQDEASDMEREFDCLIDHDPSFNDHRNFNVTLEREARTSSENLKNFFKGGHFPQGCTAHLYLVSSTFHLRRLADEAEKLIEADEKLSKSVAKIVLIGAEQNPTDEPVMLEAYYIKNMMYEVFSHMFKRRSLVVNRPGEYEGTV